jgi:hypothetical protein
MEWGKLRFGDDPSDFLDRLNDEESLESKLKGDLHEILEDKLENNGCIAITITP